MSFSSRNPPGHRQRLTRTRNSAKRGARPARHLRLWEAIRLTRDELSDWQQRTALVDGLFRQHILPRETQLTGTCCQLTDRLIDTYAEHWLGSAEQALLNLWIADNLQSLANHPFAAEGQTDALTRRWRQLLTEESAPEQQESRGRNSLLDELFDDELDEDDEVFDFGWHGSSDRSTRLADDGDTDNGDSATTSTEDIAEEPATDNAPGKAQDSAAGNEADSATIRRLEQRLSVDRLFRQLARALHPDREQDEVLKLQKHELMSECLRARKNRDINALLTLYCEHVGDLPDDLSGNEHEELLQALEQQLRQLQNELRQMRFGNPLQAQIIDRYSASSDDSTRSRILQHAESLDREIARLQSRLQQVGSRDGLLAELAERREIEQNRMIIDNLTGYSAGR
ncbi:hypothetical protein ACUNV4_25870 [Granulosicoccus sp. 3-233]|uniref:hypothetical protein n=1 Tax=Granulosicoccus sp. 3-233 TaxID=3417969 RepID=UPI003D34D5DA